MLQFYTINYHKEYEIFIKYYNKLQTAEKKIIDGAKKTSKHSRPWNRSDINIYLSLSCSATDSV